MPEFAETYNLVKELTLSPSSDSTVKRGGRFNPPNVGFWVISPALRFDNQAGHRTLWEFLPRWGPQARLGWGWESDFNSKTI